MKKKLFIALIVLLAAFGLSALDPLFPGKILPTLDEDEEDDEEDEEDEEEAEESTSKEEAQEEAEEEDPFSKESPKKDDDPFAAAPKKDEFVQSSSGTIYPDPEEDDFVVEKREKGVTHKYKKPDIGKVKAPTYLYTEASTKSKKLFELYKGDDLEILEEVNNFYRVSFLGKEGWVQKDDVLIEKWTTYRLSIELEGGVGSGKSSGGGDLHFDAVGNYALRLNVSIIQDLVVGFEGRGMSFHDGSHYQFYAGGGAMLRYYIHGLRGKKSRSALGLSAGYIGGVGKVGTKYHVSGAPYVNVSLDYFFRVWEYIALGIGGYFNYLKISDLTDKSTPKQEEYLGGAHLTLMFNVMR